MKIQQKLLAVLMVFVMLAAMVAPMTVSAETETATTGFDIRIVPVEDVGVGDILWVDVYFTGENVKSMMVTLDYDTEVLAFLPEDIDTYWGANDRTIDRYIAMSTFDNNIPTMTFSQAMSLDDVPLLHLAFEVIADTFDPGNSTLVSFGEISYAIINPSTGLEEKYDNEENPDLISVAPATVHAYCEHATTEEVLAKAATCQEAGNTAGTKCTACGRAVSGCEVIPASDDAHPFAINRYTGLMTCSVCDTVCAHETWTDSACASCGLECTHDVDNGVCIICGAAVAEQPTYAFECSCGNKISKNGVCTSCATECTHKYNVGGYCVYCGVLGDPITYSEYAETCAFGVQNGVFTQDGKNGFWLFYDEGTVLHGHNYVYEMDVKFTSVSYNSANKSGTTRFLLWSDINASGSTSETRMGLFLNGDTDNETVMLGFKDGFSASSDHVVLNLNQKYNLRVAVRSTPTDTAGTYNHEAEVSLDGKLIYTQTFQLNVENGMSLRLGDHTQRKTTAPFEVDSNFGIRFLDDTIEYIGAQEKENADYSADETFDIRFVFGFDDLYLEDVGVKVDASVSDGTEGTKVLSADGKALTAIAANGVTKKVGVNGIGYGGYYMATAITGIALDTSNTYTFTLTPYLKRINATDVTYMPYAYEITVSFDANNEMVIDYEKIA